MKILVTDGDNRPALAITRSLGRKGHRVYVVASGAKCLASCSRFCAGGFSVPNPLKDGGAYTSSILELTNRESIDVIFPTSEQSIYLLNQLRGILPNKTLLACPSQEMMQAVSNKSELFRLAEGLQVAIPATFYLNGSDELAAIIHNIDSYPVVVKPALSRIPTVEGFLSAGVRYAASRDELENLYATCPVLRYPSMIQEKIVGDGTGLFSLYDKNQHIALFSHKRLREKPPSGGVSILSESIPLDEEMIESAGRLLSAVNFTGVAMVEFKRDQRDGKPKLMEINGRFWGSLQLAISCGIDFPSLYLDYLMGSVPLKPNRSYKVGHKMKWFFGNLDYLIIRLKNKSVELNLPPGAPSKWQALANFAKIKEQNTSFDVASFRDMKPLIHESAIYLKSLWGR
ncbi:carboxylate--amine ligase [Desulforhopalus sp. 52FAK]